MTPEEEREHLEELCIASITLAIHLAEDAKDREAVTKLSGYAQSLIHGFVLATVPFRKGAPPAWVRSASERVSKQYLDSLDALTTEILAKANGSS